MRVEVGAMYAGLDLNSASMPKAGPAELNPPGGVFLVGYSDGVAICCGGVKRPECDACEGKRVDVRPEGRGHGGARGLAEALGGRDCQARCAEARLDTGPKQDGARRLYESAGYRSIQNFNGNPVATFFGEKALV